MKDKKKILFLIGIIIALVFIVIFSLKDYLTNIQRFKGSISDYQNVTSSSVYNDWSSLTSIDNDYSYSTLIFTKDTKIYVEAEDGNDVEVRYRDKVENDGTPVFQDGRATPLVTLKKKVLR